jgi:hypothetical protein
VRLVTSCNCLYFLMCIKNGRCTAWMPSLPSMHPPGRQASFKRFMKLYCLFGLFSPVL